MKLLFNPPAFSNYVINLLKKIPSQLENIYMHSQPDTAYPIRATKTSFVKQNRVGPADKSSVPATYLSLELFCVYYDRHRVWAIEHSFWRSGNTRSG